jgi:hypothetical protein
MKKPSASGVKQGKSSPPPSLFDSRLRGDGLRAAVVAGRAGRANCRTGRVGIRASCAGQGPRRAAWAVRATGAGAVRGSGTRRAVPAGGASKARGREPCRRALVASLARQAVGRVGSARAGRVRAWGAARRRRDPSKAVAARGAQVSGRSVDGLRRLGAASAPVAGAARTRWCCEARSAAVEAGGAGNAVGE